MNFLSNLKYKIKPTTIIIIIIISLFFIIVISEIISNILNNIENKKIENTNPNTVFYSIDKSIFLDIAKKYELKQYNPTNNYLLELRSNINLDIFISKKELILNKSFAEIVSADKLAYLEEFEATTNISNLNEITIQSNDPAYTYSFQYLEPTVKKAYYLQVIWIEVEDGYYIIDIELPVEYLNYHSNIITDIISGFNY